MRECRRCGHSKEEENFYQRGNGKKISICKSCSKEKLKEYLRTFDGVINTLYNSQKSSSKQRGHNPPTYTQEDFKNYLTQSKKFQELFESWVSSGFLKDLKPSIDRLNDNQGYSFNNIRITTWRENNKKEYKKNLQGASKKCKPVVQETLDGDFIQEFKSMSIASRETGVPVGNISKVCEGSRSKAGGYKWKFKKI